MRYVWFVVKDGTFRKGGCKKWNVLRDGKAIK